MLKNVSHGTALVKPNFSLRRQQDCRGVRSFWGESRYISKQFSFINLKTSRKLPITMSSVPPTVSFGGCSFHAQPVLSPRHAKVSSFLMQTGPVSDKDIEDLVLKLHEIQVERGFREACTLGPERCIFVGVLEEHCLSVLHL